MCDRARLHRASNGDVDCQQRLQGLWDGSYGARRGDGESRGDSHCGTGACDVCEEGSLLGKSPCGCKAA